MLNRATYIVAVASLLIFSQYPFIIKTAAAAAASYTSTLLVSSSAPCRTPSSVYEDTNSNIFATCYVGNNVVKYEGNGYYNATYLPTTIPCSSPRDITGDANNNIYVACQGSNYILKYVSNNGYNPVMLPQSPNACGAPTNLFVDLQNILYATCTATTAGYIAKYTPSSSSSSYNTSTLTNPNCHFPVDVWGDTNGNIFAACSQNTYVGKYTLSGNNTYTYSSLPTSASVSCASPYAVRGDANGNIFVGCSQNKQIIKYAAGSYTPIPLPTSPICNPTSLWINDKSDVFAACGESQLVQHYEAASNYTATEVPTSSGCLFAQGAYGNVTTRNLFVACSGLSGVLVDSPIFPSPSPSPSVSPSSAPPTSSSAPTPSTSNNSKGSSSSLSVSSYLPVIVPIFTLLLSMMN